MSDWKEGDKIELDYPFVRSSYTAYDEDGPYDEVTWRPGVEYVEVGPEGEADAVADGLGKQILRVVSTHKPGKYPTRVFYTVQWVAPNGKKFGKGNLRVLTAAAFTRRTRGFMSHDPYFEWRLRELLEAA